MKHWLYLALLLAWVLIIGLQWIIGWKKLWHERYIWPWAVLGLGIYFTLADALAIQQHIWFFNHALITGWSIGNVPIEEVLFYFLTTAMIVQGFVMLSPLPKDQRKPGKSRPFVQAHSDLRTQNPYQSQEESAEK